MQTRDFPRIERAPAYRLVYDAIEKQIFAGTLKVGDPLPAEIQLAEQFGVSFSRGVKLVSDVARSKAVVFPVSVAHRNRELVVIGDLAHNGLARFGGDRGFRFRAAWIQQTLFEPKTLETCGNAFQIALG